MESWDIRSLDVKVHQPEVLRSDGEARVIAINLPAGEELKDHQVHERAYLVVVEGEVEIAEGGSTETGGAGYLAIFDPNERHEVRAKADARLVLILAPWPGEGHPRARSAGGAPA
ncbi:MAG TPA: cupin domain-containing protein [Thermoleophilaceae bacterium]|nr:cupin domain-containing protein [Thermoleophilaceae bacterium]